MNNRDEILSEIRPDQQVQFFDDQGWGVQTATVVECHGSPQGWRFRVDNGWVNDLWVTGDELIWANGKDLSND
jgi:hypothetical protein